MKLRENFEVDSNAVELKIISQLQDVQNFMQRIHSSAKLHIPNSKKVIYRDVVIGQELAVMQKILKDILKEMNNLKKFT